ncbi:MAG: hypothetical protein PHC43_07490 [Candidatus Marinimicrobia bacterium]|nr:hypothetical protein [Candidatus Neomarinimicrobiota bacterium]
MKKRKITQKKIKEAIRDVEFEASEEDTSFVRDIRQNFGWALEDPKITKKELFKILCLFYVGIEY